MLNLISICLVNDTDLEFNPELPIRRVITTRVQNKERLITTNGCSISIVNIIIHGIDVIVLRFVQGPIRNADSVTWGQVKVGVCVDYSVVGEK